jgi:ABC-type nitrate/sulfonate/bicarbonate transport system permease component
VIAGFCIAVPSGIFLGILIGWWRTIRNLVEPVIEILRPIPPLAWIPLAMLWFGLGFKPAVFLIWLGAFFPILLNTVLGVESASKILIEAAKTLGAKESHLLYKVVIPSATPSIMTGLKVGFGVGWMCLVAAELTGTNSGLGFLIMYYHWIMDPAKTIAGMIMIGAIGFLMFLGLTRLEAKLLVWREAIS